ncbi:ankyrin repeat domain-containing protein [Leptonema illini]|jgi:ankyrin repeat protein|uniref:Ankyrin n=1 Tax=Leptonema illini DSM 21528 TaxID=929563 RepID=H2CEL2_9LEPT|nr:ankyrin repeat domain-containing protein [Leptonema illini]EHQ06624.1 Ankyrin [Leptonema illini DSM 21528]
MNEIEIGKELRTAIKAGDVERVVELIGDSKDRLMQITPFGTWLHVAATSGQLQVVKRLLAMGSDPNVRGGPFKGVALNHAASEGHMAVVRELLDAGSELDISEPERNPLFGAIYGGHIEIVKLLLNAGIDPSIKYTGEFMKDMDAAAFARERGQTAIVAYLESLRK